jgi:peptidyl-prolyl cis-trans isomerase C
MQKKYWKTLSIIMISLIISWSNICVSEEKTEAEEPGVAIVNGEEITQGTYYREVTRLAQQVASTGGSLDDSQISLIEKNAMDNIIGSELLYQESLKSGIKIDEKAIDENIMKQRIVTQTRRNGTVY